jgi:hypothetical protein
MYMMNVHTNALGDQRHVPSLFLDGGVRDWEVQCSGMVAFFSPS